MSVATPSAEHAAAVQNSELPRILMGGTRAMRKAAEKYLPRLAGESEDNYTARLGRTVLFNAFSKTVADMCGRVFAKPLTLETDVPEQIREYAENIDLTGRHLNVFARDVFFDALQTGGGYILADMPQSVQRADGLNPTLADERRAGLRPYLVYIPVERMIGWKSAKVNGVETLTQVRIRETVTEPDGDFGTRNVQQIRVIEPGTWQIWRQSQVNSDEWILIDEGTTKLDKITLAPICLNRAGFMTFEPPLIDLAYLNVAHWQSQSDQRNILHVARVPILFAAGWNDDSETLEIAASSLVRNSNPDANLSYVEHSGAAISAGNDDLKNLEFQMQAHGLQLLIPSPGQTATGEIRDDVKENSTLSAMALALQDALEQAFGYMAEWIGLGEDAGGSIIVNKDFGLYGRMGDVQYLTQAVIAGKLDDQTYIEELKRRGALSDSVDSDTVLARIDSAGPDLNGRPLDLHMNHDH